MINSKGLLKSHKDFLNNIPQITIKSLFTKITLLLIFGLLLSIVSVIATLVISQSNPQGSNLERLVLILSQNLPFFIITIIIFYRKDLKNMWASLTPAVSLKSFKLILIVLTIFLIEGLIVNYIQFGILFTDDKFEFLKNYVSQGEDKITLPYLITLSQSIVLFLAVAFFEEFIFRFTIFRYLRGKGILTALIISSVLFSLAHGSYSALSIFIFGIIISLYYEYTNYFWGTVLIHLIYNQFILYYTYYLVYLILK